MGVSTAVILANGYDLSAYLKSIGSGFEVDELDKTTFADRNDRTFQPGLLTASMSGEGFYDHDDVLLDAVDDVLGVAMRQKGPALFFLAPEGDTLGMPASLLDSFQTSYEIGSEVAELTTVSFEARSREGKERGPVLHALGQETANGDGVTHDDLALSSLGGAGHLHATGYTDTLGADPIVVKIQHSVDDVVWVDLVTFANVTVPHTFERVEVAGTVNRYLRAQWAVPADTTATFVVAFARH